MVEGARLERVYTGNRIEGSNPSLSAIFQESATVAGRAVLQHLTRAFAVIHFLN